MIRPIATKPLWLYVPSVPIWMGELSGGRSATSPTFCRSTSVRMRIDLQYSQTVCTLLDQRKTILAPQLGQMAVGCVIPRDSQQADWKLSDSDRWFLTRACKAAGRSAP